MASRINKNKIIAAAQKFVQKGNYDRAIREYSKVVEEDPRDVRIWLKIGDLHAKKNDTDRAIDTYSKVAEFYSEQGFYLKAVAVYKQILRIDPALVAVNLQLAELYKQLGLLNDAMKQYEQVSNFHHGEGRNREALAALRQIVELDTTNVASRIKLAELYSREQMRDEAIEEFSRAADYLRADNRIDDFIKVAERLVFHQADNIPVIRELANIYLSRGDPRRSLQKLQMAFKLDPRDEETLEMLAQAFQGLGQITKTVSVLKELARIYADTGEVEKRLKVFRQILELVPNDEEAKQAVATESTPPQPAPAAATGEPLQRPNTAALDFPPVDDISLLEGSVSGASPLPAFDDKFGTNPSIPQEPAYPTEPDFNPEQTFDPEPFRPPEPSTESAASPPVDDTHPEIITSDTDPEHETGDYDSDSQEFETEVAKIITEADVYIKYGLQDKAIEHLEQVFSRDPDNVEVRLKLKDIYVQMRLFQKASRELTLLARGLVGADRRFAADLLNEALELEPDNDQARDLLANLEGGPAEFDKTEGGTITLEADDIVEEISMESVEVIDEQSVPDHVMYDATEPQVSLAGNPSGVAAGAEDFGYTEETRPFKPVEHGVPGDSEEIVVREESHTLEDDLEEAEFFFQQSLFSEARTILEELEGRYPNNPLVTGKLEELEQLERVSQSRVVRRVPDLEQSDLSTDTGEITPGDNGQDAMHAPLDASFSVVDVFKDFKDKADDPAAEEDTDTHYDLGIAYREMGLMDDAISEFKIAMQNLEKEVLCYMMIGLCQLDKGITTDAISQFKKALYVEGITEQESVSLYFELGGAYERLEDTREALYYYGKVARKNPRFRDVSSRIERLKE